MTLKMTHRMAALASGLVLMGVVVAGCGSGDSSASGASTTGGATGKAAGGGDKPRELKIAFIGKSTSNAVFVVAETGAEKAAEELTKSTGVKITIDNMTPPNEDGQVQATKIAAAVTQGDNAILLSCSDAAKVKGAIDDAVSKGVQVMTFDSDAADSKRFAFYGADDADCGIQVMDELGKILDGKGDIAILAGNQTAPNLQKRVAAVKEEAAKKFPGIKILTVAFHPENPEAASSKVVETMHAYPTIKGWAMVGGWPLFATSLLTDLDPSKVKVVSVDALPLELPYVDKGIAPVLLAQPVFEWGHTSVGMIVDKMINHKDVPVINKMDLIRVSKDNLGDWAKTLQGWGLKPDEKFLAMAKK
jgi:ribose transport system substrate-binding protein